MKQFLRRSWPDLVVVLCFLLLSFAYFATPISEGLVLGGHDTVAGMGQGQEQAAYHEATGERSRWTNSIFSGMPTYQISPTYGSTKVMSVVETVVRLCTSGPLGFLFLYLFGFYLLMRALRFKPLLSAFGATAWAFSSYFLIIIAAGHLWKVNTLGFIPPTIAGLVLAYRGKYLWGATVTALFAALQIAANHLQMTYYFLFVMLFVAVAYGIEALRSKTLGRWAKATGALVVGGLLAAAVNLPNLYHTWQYSKESMRGKTELTTPSPKKAEAADAPSAEGTDGLARDYITQWSYGVDETLTLLMPDFKGGGSSSILDREGIEKLEGYNEFYQYATQLQQATGSGNVPGILQYWGDQPFTVGPVYVGAIICFLFVLGLGLVRGPLKWALAAATLLSFLFAWGHNFMAATDFFIDVLPMYSKFRTVSSALVIAEFTMPVLAMLALAEVDRPSRKISHAPRQSLPRCGRRPHGGRESVLCARARCGQSAFFYRPTSLCSAAAIRCARRFHQWLQGCPPFAPRRHPFGHRLARLLPLFHRPCAGGGLCQVAENHSFGCRGGCAPLAHARRPLEHRSPLLEHR